jgi:hypothetical protein
MRRSIMCKKIIVLSLVLVFAGSASAIIERTFTVGPTGYGTTCSGLDPGYCDQGSYMYLGNKWGGGCTGTSATNDITGWGKFVVPDFSAYAVPQTVLSVVFGGGKAGTNGGRPWDGLTITRVSDTSWTTSNINNSWAVTSDVVNHTPQGGATSTLNGVYYTDISSWWGAGKESTSGNDTCGIRFTPNVLGGQDPQRLPWSWQSLIITTVPEPATIALLGLGGLALLRKRR